MTEMTLANISPKSSSFCFRGVRSEIWETMLVWMSPIAVDVPVPVTIALPWPTVTVVPCVSVGVNRAHILRKAYSLDPA